MKLTLYNDNVLCKSIAQSEKKLENGFVYKTNDIELYEVISIPVNYKGMFKAGDIVMSNSTGTKIEVDEVEYVVFKDENIVAKINEQ